MKTVCIYTCHHKPSAFLSSSVIQPIHVGKINTANEIGCIGDDTGDNISFKNPFYCELTAHYWVWKNQPKTAYVGFMHYRRHFNFSSQQNFPEDSWGVVNHQNINEDYERKFGLNDESIISCIGDNDIIVPRKWSVKSAGSKNNFDHYAKGEYLHIRDYQLAIDIISERFPEYLPAVDEFNNASEGYYTNMFIIKYDLFEKYSEWLFSILRELENRLAMNNYNPQEQRVIGHIAERLFNIFLINLNKNKKLKIKELQRTFITTERFLKPLQPAYATKNVPVVISFDNNYALSGGALLKSIVQAADANKNYDVVILENKVSELNKKRLNKIIEGHSNFKLRFFDVNIFSELNKLHTRAHFSASTYARLYIPALFENYERVIFIDSDTIVKSDLSELLDIDLNENLVAAVQDIVMEGFVQFGTMSESDDGIMPAGDYLRKTLGMSNLDEYFQAGIIVFNIQQMKIENTFSKLIDTMLEKKYWFLDQDIMNKVFYGRVHFLPAEWNVYHGNGNTNDFFPNLKFSTYMRFLRSRINPKMIHFAGENKPWNTREVDFFDDFIANVNGTPWESECYSQLFRNDLGNSKAQKTSTRKYNMSSQLFKFIKTIVNKYAPIGTARRNVLVKLYYKVK